MTHFSFLTLIPAVRNYVWGGRAFADLLGAPPEVPVAEVWTVYENNLVAAGDLAAARTLAQLVLEYPTEILGARLAARGITRFPLLVKLLDCARWLSLQVHPNDQQAAALEGPGFLGKTEAWYILAAQPDAQLIAGIKPGTSIEALHAAIGKHAILDLVEYHRVQTGDTIFMPAGAIHALGPGLLVYEVQQTSDLTYRVFDWNRPQTEGRALHIEKSIAVTDPQAARQIIRAEAANLQPARSLVQSPYFHLEQLSGPQERHTRGESFHALTAIAGEAHLATDSGELILRQFNSVLIPAACGAYRLEGEFKLLCSSIAD